MMCRLLCTALLLLSHCAGELPAELDSRVLADGPMLSRDSRFVLVDGGGDALWPTELGQAADRGPALLDVGDPTHFKGQPGEFTAEKDGRPYRFLVPSGYRATRPIPLVVAFHGAGDDGANFYQICKASGWGSATEPNSFILLVPNTKSPFKDFAIWTGDPNNDIGAMKGEMAAIIAIVEGIGQDYNIDRTQVHALGFSDGGLFTAVAGLDRSDFFASLTVMGYGWGGNYPGGVTPSRKLGTQFVCGSFDSFYSSARASSSWLQANGHATVFRLAIGAGHRFSSLMAKHDAATLFGWMRKNPRSN